MSVVEKSVGTKMFQTIYAEVNGRKTDITKDGDLSCAFFVTGVLSMFDLVDRVHATVKGTVIAMEVAGWKETKNLKPGVVIKWGPSIDGNFTHEHLGFFVGDDQAISNIHYQRIPGRHHYTFGKKGIGPHRPILALYHHPKLK